MADFQQVAPLATIHSLSELDPDRLHGDLLAWARKRPPVLLVPALATELGTPAFRTILSELGKARYLKEAVLVLGRAGRSDYAKARALWGGLPFRAAVVWPEGPELQAVFEGKGRIDPGPPGKGRDVWIALGYILARGGCHALALHDADIVTYTASLPKNLLAPLLHPELSFDFCKGYYPRVSGGKMAGRVTRLLVAPLAEVLSRRLDSPFPRFVLALRYPLAGEFALTADLAWRLPVPRDWGLEIGVLSAAAGLVSPDRICQAQISSNYEHKHQELSPGDTARGLARMAVEVAAALLRGSGAGPAECEGLAEAYREAALEWLPKYRADALVNGLVYDLEQEKGAVSTFHLALGSAIENLPAPQEYPPLPPWKAVRERFPDLADAVREAVEKEGGKP